MSGIDCMTIGVQSLIANGNRAVAAFAAGAPGYLRKEEPSMAVGRPGTNGVYLEDDGHTVIIALPSDCKTLYACKNETGGVTVMLAEEY